MNKPIISLMILGILLILISGCSSPVVRIDDFECRSSFDNCEILAKQYMVFDVMKGYNFTEVINAIEEYDNK